MRYNSFGSWLQRRFGGRVHKLSVDGGFTCPNRDGTVAWGGCTYCNNDSFRADETRPENTISEQVQSGIKYLSRRYRATRFLVYWQNFSNTYGPIEQLRPMYNRALGSDSRIVGMTIGTRPDCVEDAKLDMIQEVVGSRYVCLEYGMESIYDRTLKRLNRGHDLDCYLDAVKRTRSRGLPVCTHIILGFPGESRDQLLAYPEVLNRLGIDFLKIHHLHVVAGTQLGLQYKRDPFPLFGVEDWVELVCDVLERLEPRIVIQRLFGWAPNPHLVAPRWNRSRAELLQAIHTRLKDRDSWQGKALGYPRPAFKAAF